MAGGTGPPHLSAVLLLLTGGLRSIGLQALCDHDVACVKCTHTYQTGNQLVESSSQSLAAELLAGRDWSKL